MLCTNAVHFPDTGFSPSDYKKPSEFIWNPPPGFHDRTIPPGRNGCLDAGRFAGSSGDYPASGMTLAGNLVAGRASLLFRSNSGSRMRSPPAIIGGFLLSCNANAQSNTKRESSGPALQVPGLPDVQRPADARMVEIQKMTESPRKPIRKILVVEDSRTQAEYLRHILENEGYRVTLAENGDEALGQIAIDMPSIVFTDVVMPGMDGYELCRRIKGDERTFAIPVILVTQLFDPADVIRGLESGADDFIIKPFEAGYIRSRIGTILSAMDRPDPDGLLPPLPVVVGDRTYTVSSSRVRIFNILLSTYEVAVSKNSELLEAQERLSGLNEQLRQVVEDLKKSNHNLEQENAERRRVEKALDEANRKLNLMASITRHDVLNQLTTQHEHLESALAAKEQDRTNAWSQVASAKTITEQTINAIRFTGDYQKIGIKAPAWQELRALIAGAIQATPAGNIVVENHVAEKTEVYADPLIGRIFTNLIENAVKYGQTITAVRFSMVERDGATVIVCEDNGVGIPPENKEKIFSYEHGMNTSMGLFLSREILALTGITITEIGEYRKGARFEIACPPATIRRA